MAAVALLPVLAGCSSSSSIEYVADAFPSQSLVDIVKGAAAPAPRQEPAPPVAMTAPPAPASSDAPPPVQAAAAAPSVAAPAAPTPPPAATEEADPVAAAFPSVSLIDLLSGTRKPAQ